ncbi:DNA replication/repair protein RecF [Helcococcus kunzii]|uniref:DNA replication and repair protein RecF n=1 Tax=Helcococcus kunzii ATCC 51366 TaxID=883114 RepID=H3NQT9_9FIRM|nr:DNA replication/repair protein RecF [Helcococcus kunzii]EHR32086.1 DNA replication and repair protein RecF [Helcococcus kunzii ATCC 51366]
MIIKELKLINHRNYENEDIIFHDNTNILVGKNAQGKTNLLEAIYICARGYSFKNLKEDELIKFDENRLYLKADILNNNRKKVVEIVLSKNDKKKIRINEVEVKNLSELKSQFGVVIFSPEEVLIVKETPQMRRRFIDDIISNNDISYKVYLNNYNKIRSQKNELLKKGSNVKYFDQILNTYNQKMVEYGSTIAIYRYKYLEILKKFASEFHYELSSNNEKLEIEYENNFASDFTNLESIRDDYAKILEENREKEIQRFVSIYGPHKDDILLNINGKEAKTFGSQGQQRTVMLSLKLGEARLIETITNTKPILLWDDVFSELDNTRASLLVEKSKNYQNIITTNSLINIDLTNMNGNIYTINNGKVKNERKKNGKEYTIW